MVLGIVSVVLIVVGSALFAALAVVLDNLSDKIVASMK